MHRDTAAIADATASGSIARLTVLVARVRLPVHEPLVRSHAGSVGAVLGLGLARVLVDPAELGRAACFGSGVHFLGKVGGGALARTRGTHAILVAHPLALVGVEEVCVARAVGLRQDLAEIALVPSELGGATCLGVVVGHGVADGSTAAGAAGTDGAVLDAASRGAVVGEPLSGRGRGGRVVLVVAFHAGDGRGLALGAVGVGDVSRAACLGGGMEDGIGGEFLAGFVGGGGAILGAGVVIPIHIPQIGVAGGGHGLTVEVRPGLAVIQIEVGQAPLAACLGGIVKARSLSPGVRFLAHVSTNRLRGEVAGAVLLANTAVGEPLLRPIAKCTRLGLTDVLVEVGELFRAALFDGVVRGAIGGEDASARSVSHAILYAEALGGPLVELLASRVCPGRPQGEPFALALIIAREFAGATFLGSVVHLLGRVGGGDAAAHQIGRINVFRVAAF
mmetsp:Transcript_34139/g.82553  ORF Transcript_34139/g.82553 Transcript_34139/m.82553 type:complete len:449 (+) Transcript_34139:630-1976(+)